MVGGWRLRVALFRITGFWPRRLYLFRQALTHKSGTHARNHASFNYERLEFLGDAVLSLMVSHFLYRKFPDAREGYLTRVRAAVVSRNQLQHMAWQLGVFNLIDVQLPSSVQLQHTHIPGDVMEALIGALYVDLGYPRTYRFFEKRLWPLIPLQPEEHEVFANHKGHLIQLGQLHGWDVAFVELDTGAHQGIHKHCMSVKIDGAIVAQATGFSKKQAAQKAAYLALQQLPKNTSQPSPGF